MGFLASRTVYAWVGVLSLSLLSACAELAKDKGAPSGPQQPVVFPPPPDPPRFVYERTLVSSSQIVPESADDRLRRVLTGVTDGGEGMSKPYAVVVHKGRIFVSDTVDRVVKVFDVPQGRFFRIGEDGPGQLSKPLGMDIADDGTLFVADSSAKAIVVYNRDGTFLRKFGGSEAFDRLSSVSVDPAGRRLYVVDIGGVNSKRHVVNVLSAVDGSLIQTIGTRGKGDGEFNLPRDAVVGKDGRVYVVDGGNFRVQIFDANGDFLKSFGGIGRRPGNFAHPKEISADRDGNVYVVDAAYANVQLFNAEGELLMYIGERDERPGPAHFLLPAGIHVDEDGRIYMVDQWYRKIDVFRPVGLKENQGHLVYKPARK